MKRSMALWARTGSAKVGNHSSGPRLDVTIMDRDDHGPCAMPLGQEFVSVAALGRIHGIEGEVVDDEQVDADEFAQLGLVGVVEPGVLQGFQHLVCP